VIWARRFFPELMAVTGDVGARGMLATVAEAVAEVPVNDVAVTVDVDTPEALAKVSETAR
jgi:molybdenum cofactor cytidylyltransferase